MDGPALTVDSATGSARRRHFAHPGTGEYRGKQILFKAALATSPQTTPKATQKDTKKADKPKVLEAPAGAARESKKGESENK